MLLLALDGAAVLAPAPTINPEIAGRSTLSQLKQWTHLAEHLC
jgi:hypothetical protein